MLTIAFIGEQEGVHEKRFLRAFADRNIEVHFFPISSLESNPDILRNAYHAGDIQLVVGGPMHHAAIIQPAILGIPYIAVSYAYDVLLLAKNDPTIDQDIKSLISHTQSILCDCVAVKDALSEMGANPAHILVAAWGLESRGAQVEAPEIITQTIKTWKQDNAQVAICVRNFSPLHGVDQVIKAFSKAHQTNPHLRLILTGDGPLKSEITQLVKSLSIQHSVLFTGNISEKELRAVFEHVDLYISASLVDGTSISLLQALDAGLPVILSRVGGNIEWANQTTGASLFDSGNISALAALFIQASEHPSSHRFDRNKELNLKANWQRNADAIVHFCKPTNTP